MEYGVQKLLKSHIQRINSLFDFFLGRSNILSLNRLAVHFFICIQKLHSHGKIIIHKAVQIRNNLRMSLGAFENLRYDQLHTGDFSGNLFSWNGIIAAVDFIKKVIPLVQNLPDFRGKSGSFLSLPFCFHTRPGICLFTLVKFLPFFFLFLLTKRCLLACTLFGLLMLSFFQLRLSAYILVKSLIASDQTGFLFINMSLQEPAFAYHTFDIFFYKFHRFTDCLCQLLEIAVGVSAQSLDILVSAA